jgi:hypothetical protein
VKYLRKRTRGKRQQASLRCAAHPQLHEEDNKVTTSSWPQPSPQMRDGSASTLKRRIERHITDE